MSNELLPLNDPEALRRRWRRRAVMRKGKRAVFGALKRYGINDLPRLILGVAVVAVFVLSFSAAALSVGLPNPARLASQRPLEATKVLDRNGVVLYDIFGEKRRNAVPLAELPETIKQATIAAEDQDFYLHGGFDLKGLFRGVILQPLRGRGVQGGSTITQQLAKNSYLSPTRSVGRKIKELILAIEIEQMYTKNRILEMYLNEIPYGGRLYGVETAAQTYFGVSSRDITLAQSALLAALPQSPTYYSPYGQHPDELMVRKDWVLERMFEEGFITERQMVEAKAEEIEFQPRKDSIRAPHFVMYVKELLADRYGEKLLEEGGLTITTTLDWELQKAAEDAISARADTNLERYNAGNAALVSLDPETGEILAMVGSKDYFDLEADGNVNVTIRERQPGSSIKPIVYAAAFKKQYGPATMLMDVKTDFGNGYSPNNYDGNFRGPMSIRSALQGSINVPAVKALAYAGVNATIDLAHKMGITTLNDPERYGLSLVLGGGEVTLLDLTSAYGVFATGGDKADLMSVIKVEDSKGRILEENEPKPTRRALDPEVAYLINNILSDDSARAPFFGAGGALTLPGRVAAAKTGTTDLYRDGWTVGYTPNLVTGVWAGNNRGELMDRGGGLSVAAPIWNAYMRKAVAGLPNLGFSVPQGIRTVIVDALSGKLPSDATPETKTEVFTSWGVPTEEDDVHKKIRVVSAAPDRLPPKNFPVELTEERVFVELHSERPNNPSWERPVIEWAEENGYNNIPNQIYDGSGGSTGELSILSPTNGAVITGDFFITAEVADEPAVEKVSFYYDGNLVHEASQAPWRTQVTGISLDGQSHPVRVRLTKVQGAPVEAVVSIVAGGNTAQSMITMQVPSSQSFPIDLTAQLSDSGKNLNVDKVEIYFDEQLRETFLPNSSGIYVTTIREGVPGQHTAWAKVTDKSGQAYSSNKIQVGIL